MQDMELAWYNENLDGDTLRAEIQSLTGIDVSKLTVSVVPDEDRISSNYYYIDVEGKDIPLDVGVLECIAVEINVCSVGSSIYWQDGNNFAYKLVDAPENYKTIGDLAVALSWRSINNTYGFEVFLKANYCFEDCRWDFKHYDRRYFQWVSPKNKESQ